MRLRPIAFSFFSAVASIALPCILNAQQRTPPPAEFVEWLPISDSDRQAKSPVVEKDAGAEILLSRVHVSDEYLNGGGLQRVLYHYVRMKVFNSSAKEKVGTVDLPYREPGGIVDVAGRTIKADGTIIELDRKTVYKRDLVRASGLKEKVVSFAMPGVEEGAIVEYRWRQSEDDNRFRYLRLSFASDLPVQTITYFVRPLSSEYVASDQMFILPFNCKPTPVQRGNDGWNQTTVTNVPAKHAEPYSPSTYNTDAWALLYYRSGNDNAQKYWNDHAKKAYGDFKGLIKADADQKAAALKAVSDAKTDEERILAIILAVRARVKHFGDPEVTVAERDEFIKKMPKDRERNSAEIFKGSLALSSEMNLLVGALATQAGLDVRPAMIGNRNEGRIDPRNFADEYFADDIAIAIKAGDSWKFFEVTDKRLYPAMLPAEEEGMFAIVTDSKAPILTHTPVPAPEASSEIRTAKLKLSAKGSLAGDVDEGYTGHRAEYYRSILSGKSAAQAQEWFHDRLLQMFPDADVTALKVENMDDSLKPLQVSYHMDAPFFAQVTGKRMLFEPNAFRRAQASPFSASDRSYPVEFPYAWKEVDDIHIELPQGFELDNADSPGGFDFGDAGSYKLSIRVQKGAATELVTSREFVFGAKAVLQFPVTSYPTVKRVFDQVRLRDTHTLSVKGN
jgi:hypothetical protein